MEREQAGVAPFALQSLGAASTPLGGREGALVHHVTFFVGAFWFRLCCVDDGTSTRLTASACL